ncbi:hypothetical protein BD413DRAFT_175186 [Trametes elegans]|nr:hypothetical protein BD413DRAFT_175186 [Trametes elegans]
MRPRSAELSTRSPLSLVSHSRPTARADGRRGSSAPRHGRFHLKAQPGEPSARARLTRRTRRRPERKSASGARQEPCSNTAACRKPPAGACLSSRPEFLQKLVGRRPARPLGLRPEEALPLYAEEATLGASHPLLSVITRRLLLGLYEHSRVWPSSCTLPRPPVFCGLRPDQPWVGRGQASKLWAADLSHKAGPHHGRWGGSARARGVCQAYWLTTLKTRRPIASRMGKPRAFNAPPPAAPKQARRLQGQAARPSHYVLPHWLPLQMQ